MMMTNKSLDRISYSFGCKINMGNYESVDVHMSLSTDVSEGETLDKALKRAQKFVESKVEEKRDEYVAARDK